MAVLPGNPKCTMTSCWMASLGFVYGLLLGNWEYQTECPRRNCTPLPILAWTERTASDKIKTRSARIIGNLRTTRKFTTTTYVDWEKTGTRTSVSAGEKKLKMQSVGRLTTTTLNVVRNKVFRNGVFLNNARSNFLSHTSNNFSDDDELFVLYDLFERKNTYFPYEIIQLSTWMRWPSPSVCQSLDFEKETFWCDSCFPYKVYFLYIKDIWFALPKYVQINLSLTTSLARPRLLSFLEVKINSLVEFSINITY